MSSLTSHLEDHRDSLDALDGEVARIRRWAVRLTARLLAGGRLLAAGSGGSATHAQHLTAELVGRHRRERQAFSAIALHEATSVPAIVDDYGVEEAFARQVRAHGRRQDVLIVISTDGRGPNLLTAVDAARDVGLTVLALTGPGPNPVAAAADDAICIPGSTATVEELHQVAVHLVCEAVDEIILGEDNDVIDLEDGDFDEIVDDLLANG